MVRIEVIPLHIREAVLADVEELVELSKRTFTQTFGAGYPPEDLENFLASAYTVERYCAYISDSKSNVWVVASENTLCGYVLAGACSLPHLEVKPGDGEVIRLYMLQEYQGCGWGTKLFETALDWLIASGAATLWLGVWSENYGAQKLYHRYGFSYAGEYEFIVGNSRDREFIYRKALL